MDSETLSTRLIDLDMLRKALGSCSNCQKGRLKCLLQTNQYKINIKNKQLIIICKLLIEKFSVSQ